MKQWIEVTLIVIAFFFIAFLLMPEGVEPNEWGRNTYVYLIVILGFYFGVKMWKEKHKAKQE